MKTLRIYQGRTYHVGVYDIGLDRDMTGFVVGVAPKSRCRRSQFKWSNRDLTFEKPTIVPRYLNDRIYDLMVNINIECRVCV